MCCVLYLSTSLIIFDVVTVCLLSHTPLLLIIFLKEHNTSVSVHIYIAFIKEEANVFWFHH